MNMSFKVRARLFSFLIVLAIFCGGFQANAQGYRIKVNISGYTNDTLLLGYHFGDKQYIRDSAYRSKEGFVFTGDTLLEAGMYLIVTQPGHDFFQILVDRDKQQFSIETTNDQLAENVRFKGSKINQDFDSYLDFITSRRLKADSLSQLAKSATHSDNKSALELQIKQVDQEVKAKQQQILKEHSGGLLALLIGWSLDVELPEFKEFPQDQRDLAIFNYYKTHFFDFAEFKDDRIVRIPLFAQKIDRYIQHLTVQHPDSINQSLDFVLSRCQPGSEALKFLLSNYLNFYANSKFVGMDAVYVHLVENYYATGKAPWIDSESLAKMTKDASALKPLLIDKIAPDITVFKSDHTPVRLHELKAQYTILLFWAPDCGHCKKSMPSVVEFYEKYKVKGVEILAVCTKLGTDEKTCWDEVRDMHMGAWLNASDPMHSSHFKVLYDLKTTPQIYILDENKKILTKKIASEQLGDVMDKLLNIKE